MEAEREPYEPLRYSPIVIAEATHPKNMGHLPTADIHGVLRGACGDTVEIYLQIDGDRIERATFVTNGHEPAIAAGSVLTTMVQGLSLEESARIDPADLVVALGGLPAAKVHCAELVVTALRETIAHWWRVEGDTRKNQKLAHA